MEVNLQFNIGKMAPYRIYMNAPEDITLGILNYLLPKLIKNHYNFVVSFPENEELTCPS